MKTVVFLVLLCSSVCASTTTTTNVVGDITTRIYRRTGEEGIPVRRIETSYRGKTEILQTIIRHYNEGNHTSASHAYCVGGKMALTEDVEGGKITDFTVSLAGTDDFELFSTQADGSLKPASNEQIELVKKQIAVQGEAIDAMLRQTKSGKDIDKTFRETRSKIRELQKQEVAATNIVGEITRKTTEYKGFDRKPDMSLETLYRGKAEILQVVSRRNKEGKMVVWSRTFSVDGKSVATESDEDGDGVFESVILHSPDTDDIKIFKRNADGTVTPASTAEIESVKKTTAAALEPLGKLSDHPEMSDVEFGRSIEESRQKIQEIDRTNAIH